MPVTEVYILGEKLTIKGDAPEAETRELAKYIDKCIKNVCGKYPSIQPNKALILALFNVAEELHRLKKEQEILTKDITETTRQLAGLID